MKDLITSTELARAGLDANAIAHAKRSMHKVARGAYLAEPPTSPQADHVLRAAAAVTRRAVPHVASHITAAAVWGLPMFDEDLDTVHLTSAVGHPGRRAKVHTHRGDIGDMEHVDGLPVTPLVRTLIECARTMPLDQAVAMMDFALHEERVAMSDLTAGLRSGSTGAAKSRSVLALTDGRAESVGESRTRLILLDAGIAVTPQVWIHNRLGEGFARVDLAVDGYRIAIEFHGKDKYTKDTKRAWREKVRREAIEDQGWVVIPVYWVHLYTPGEIVARVRRVMQRSAPLR